MKICLVGAGRIAEVHSKNIYNHRKITLKYVIDINFKAANKIASKYNAIPLSSIDEALDKNDFDSVLIASSTNTHVDFIKRFSNKGKNILCEKPIDLNIKKVDECIKTLKKNKTTFCVGFMRRFDPSLMKLKKLISKGKVGKIQMLSITARDPIPPPINYIKSSGGIFLDSQIHDIDLARWLLEEEPIQVLARGSCLINKKIGQSGDFDTAMTILKTQSGKLCQINNSRQTVYGYDQRVEVFGTKGMINTTNLRDTNLEITTHNSTNAKDNYQYFFLERYKEAFINELDNFFNIVQKKLKPTPSFDDGRLAMKVAIAATKSAKTNKIITIS